MTSFFRQLAWLLILTLSIQNALALGLSSAQMMHYKTFAQGDFSLVCTGTEMKWISLSKTHTKGQFVFVDNPLVDDDVQLNCTNHILSDLPHTIQTNSDQLTVPSLRYHALQLRLFQRHYTAFAYQTKQTRGPPHIVS